MKNILYTALVILPLLIATSSHAGALTKAVKTAKEVKKVVRAEEALAFDPFIGRMWVAPFGTVERKVKIFEKLRTRAANLFKSNLSPESKHSMINELNAAEDYFRRNPLRMDREWTKNTFIEHQTKIINHYSYRLRTQEIASNAAQGTGKKGGSKVGSR